MQPLSPRTRRRYLYAMTLLFFVVVPIAVLYSSGYRYESGEGLVRTGGIFLSIPYAGATVSLDGEVIGTTGFLNRSFYIDDLGSRAFDVEVMRESSKSWRRTLVVEPAIVTRADVVLVPEDMALMRLVRGGRTSTTTRGVSAAVYDAYRAAFRSYATSTASVEQEEDFVAFAEGGNVRVRWTDLEKNPPDNFCTAPSECVNEIVVEGGSETALSVGLYAGGIVYATREGGVFFSEIDVRPTPVSLTLYPKAGAGVRVVDGALIVKDGETLYQVDGF